MKAGREKPLAPEVAREFLNWKLADQDSQRLNELTAKSKNVGLSPEEFEEAKEICQTVDLLSLLHLQAREALGEFK